MKERPPKKYLAKGGIVEKEGETFVIAERVEFEEKIGSLPITVLEIKLVPVNKVNNTTQSKHGE